MNDRGPDSAGFAIYGDEAPGRIKLLLRGEDAFDWDRFRSEIGKICGEAVLLRRENHALLSAPSEEIVSIREAVSALPDVSIVSEGKRMEIYKEVGLPSDVAKRFRLESMTGTHGIGHTRMATESAVTTKGAHPFTTGIDQCLVHNGSLSNHRSLRRALEYEGLTFETDNDSEVAAGYLTAQMNKGRDLGQALQSSLKDLDGFFTFVVGTETGFGVLRDPIACKPAIMAETPQYVAFGSEYRALAALPGIDEARVWEPEPARVYFWQRPQ